jgi:hypothetical protein
VATTTLTTSFKTEILQGGHNWTATLTPTGNTTNTSTSVSSVSSVANIAVGSPISGTGIPANTVVAAVPSSSTLTLSQAATATNSGVTLTISGDTFKILLIKPSPSGTYDSTLSNVGTPGSGAPSTSNVGTDESSGAGYASGGFTLTNVTPANSSGTAYTTPSVNPSWTSASFSTVAAVVYNTSARLGGVTNRTVSVHDLGGTQTVASGTFTLVLPSNSNTTGLIRIS